MPQIISEDAKRAVVDTGNGRQVTVAKTKDTEKLLNSYRQAQPTDMPSDRATELTSDSSDIAAQQADDALNATPPPDPRAPASAPAPAPAPQAQSQAASAPVAAPPGAAPQAPSNNTTLSQSPIAQAGLEMVGAGFQKGQEGIAAADKAVKDGALAGVHAAAAKAAAINTMDSLQEQRDKAMLQEEAAKQQLLTDKMTEVNKAKEAYVNAAAIDPNRVWNSLHGWNKALAAISLVLGGIGASTNGGVNPALKILNDAIDRDVKAQQSRRDQLKDSYEMSRQGLNDTREDLLAQRDNYLFHKQIRLDALSRHLGAIEAQQQGTEIGTRAAQLRAELQMQSGELQRQQGQLYLSTLPNMKDIKPEQWQAAGLYNRMKSATDTIDALERQGFNGSEYSTAIGKRLPEAAKSEAIKKYNAALSTIAESAQLAEGGRYSSERTAAIMESLAVNAGDSLSVRQQKRAQLQNYVNQLQMQAGPAIRLMPAGVSPDNAPIPTGFKPLK